MVHEEIWAYATLDKPANFLCIGCLEKRIGRILTPADFSNVYLNLMLNIARSARLKNRMGLQ